MQNNSLVNWKPAPDIFFSKRNNCPVERKMNNLWTDLVNGFDFAFQPIVNIHNGHCLGYEALLRGTNKCGFPTPIEFLDHAYAGGVLSNVEAALHNKALDKFRKLPQGKKLFLNLDNRVVAPETAEAVNKMAREYSLTPSDIIIEISERFPWPYPKESLANRKREQSCKIALDDFGIGFSGLQLLYSSQPDFVKIDRFFIAGIAEDSRKRAFLSNIVNIAHVLGAMVIAEGVETEAEFYVCRNIGCDLVQGFLIQKPTTETEQIVDKYNIIAELNQRDRRRKDSVSYIITAQIEPIPPVKVDTPMGDVFQRFRNDKSYNFIPVVNSNNEPLGIVRERDLRDFIYSNYGKDIIRNKHFGYCLGRFLRSIPVADLNSKPEKILETFSAGSEEEGVIMTDNMKYAGFLTASSLLKVINDRNIAFARDQNPLTRLPGNNMIHEYLSDLSFNNGQTHIIVYFDFDNFKPFNDKYGFRQGDRAILLFADMLRETRQCFGAFVAHIGGDDFFSAFLPGSELAEAEAAVQEIIGSFARQAQSFYDEETRERGFIQAQDREGQFKQFPLLTVSAAVLEITAFTQLTDISQEIASLKKFAKHSPEKMASKKLLPNSSINASHN